MNLIFSIKRIVKKILFATNRNAFSEFNSFLVSNNGILSREAPINLEKCCIMIESLQLNYRLTDGTILGIHRDGRLIPHDNDIDVDILVSENLDNENEGM